MNSAKPRETRTERLAAQIIELSDRAKLDTWSEFIREIAMPVELYPAIITRRPALMPKGRALTAEECQGLYDLIATLIETNAALREHTEQTAVLVRDWNHAFRGLQTLAGQIDDFANFRRIVGEGDGEEERAA